LLYLNEKTGDEDTTRIDMTTEIRPFLPLQIDKTEYNNDIFTSFSYDSWKIELPNGEIYSQ